MNATIFWILISILIVVSIIALPIIIKILWPFIVIIFKLILQFFASIIRCLTWPIRKIVQKIEAKEAKEEKAKKEQIEILQGKNCYI